MQNIKKVLRKYEETNNEIFKYFLNNYIVMAKENSLLELLDKVLEYNPSISLVDIDDTFFKNNIYIKYYDIDFIARNIERITPKELQYGINDPDIKDRIIIISNLGITLSTINKNLLFDDKIDNTFFVDCKHILSNYLLNKFINEKFVFDKEDLDYMLCISKNDDEKKYFEFFVYNFPNINKQETKMIIRHEKKYFNKLVNLFDNYNINLNMSFKDFIDYYDNNEKLLKTINLIPNKDIKENFRLYFNSYITISNVNDLNNIKLLNYKHNRQLIKDEINPNKIKDIITNTYFCITYKEFLDISLDVIKYSNNILSITEQKMISILINETNKKNLLILFDDLYKNNDSYNLIINVQKKYKEYCKCEIVNNLYKTNTKAKTIKFDGQPFNFIVHKIKGYGFMEMANKISNDPSLWGKNYIEDSYISTSLISDSFLGVNQGIGTILGFTNINSDDILDMGPTDIYTSISSFKSKRKNEKSRFIPSKNLIEETNMMYNEIVLRRYRNKTAIIPDFVLCFDDISANSKRIANYFSIPIYIIDTKEYINKMNLNLSYLLENNEFQKYYNYRNKKYYSIINNYELINKEVNEEKLYNEFFDIVKKMEKDLKANYDKNKELQYARLLERLNNKNKSIISRNNYYNNKIYKINNKDISNYLKLTK